MRSSLSVLLLLAACTRSGGTQPPSQTPAPPQGDARPVHEEPDGADAGPDQASIDGAIRARLVDLRACYDARVAKDPELEGVVFATFVIDEHGAANELNFTSDAFEDAELNGCLAGILSNIEFPPSPADGDIAVKYPLDFRADR